MPRRSAGLVLFRRAAAGDAEVLLAHPGGPYWQHKDLASWTIPKGGVHEGEAHLDAARREFTEETGFRTPEPGPGAAPYLELRPRKQKSGKLVLAWAVEGDADPARLVSNTCRVEWPPRSGRTLEVPEIDRVEWFAVQEAHRRILPGQAPFLDDLARALDLPEAGPPSGLSGGDIRGLFG